MSEIKTIGFVGLGIMGKPMALNLIKAGYELKVHDLRRPPVYNTHCDVVGYLEADAEPEVRPAAQIE